MRCQCRCSPIAYDSAARSSAVAPSNPTSLGQAVLGQGMRIAGFLFQLGGPNPPPKGYPSTQHFFRRSAPSGDAMLHGSSFFNPTLPTGFSHFLLSAFAGIRPRQESSRQTAHRCPSTAGKASPPVPEHHTSR